MLGIDWLTENRCKWHFVERQVEIKGRMIPLRNRRSLAGVRRVRVAEDVCVPPDTQVNVPVKLTRNSLPHRDRRDGYRPTGAGRASPKASEVDLGHSEQIDVRPDQLKPTLNCRS